MENQNEKNVQIQVQSPDEDEKENRLPMGKLKTKHESVPYRNYSIREYCGQ